MLALQQCVMSMQVPHLFKSLPCPAFILTQSQHSAAAWYHLVSFTLGKENNDTKAAAALLQDAVITVPRCLALRLMYVAFKLLSAPFHFIVSQILKSGIATFWSSREM